jgi:hypothetical protein
MLANSKLLECSALRGPTRPVKDATEPSSEDCEGEGEEIDELEEAVDGGEEWLSVGPPQRNQGHIDCWNRCFRGRI